MVEQLGRVESNELFGMVVAFDNIVEQTISDWQIKPVTLLTRFGGLVGVGKNLLWIIIFICSSMSLVFNMNMSKEL